MRVFLTGATGFVGSAIVNELVGAGHQVLGLSRSDAGAHALTAAGAEVHRGSLEDLESLKKGVAAADAVIHTAFIHDFSAWDASLRADEVAIEAMGSVLAGSGKAFLVTSGTLGLTPGKSGAEDDDVSPAMPRRSETAGLALVAKNVKAMCIRLSPSVHGDGDHGFVPALVKHARDNGYAMYVGEGTNRWPAVHRLDAARLYRLALEKGVAGGRYHGVAEEGVQIRQVADVISKRLGVPAVSKTPDEATKQLGFIGHVLGADAAVTSTLTQERLGWKPTERGLLEDLAKGTYFDG